MKNALFSFFGLFTRNWGLKILALVLAIVLYHSLKPANGTRQDTHNDRSFFQPR